MMIKLNNKCIDTIQKYPDIKINFNDIESVLKETIKLLNKNIDKFLAFAYELRKQDENNSHSSLLLKGNVKPAILTDIILSNYWDSKEKKMKCDFDKSFKLKINGNYNLVYMKNYFKNMTEYPIIKKEGVDKINYSNEVYFLLC